MKKFLFIMIACLCFPAVFVAAQTAADMDRLLNMREISYAQAARFVLPAAGFLADDAAPEAAFVAARREGWLPAEARPEALINFDELSFLIMNAFEISGGLLYSLFPGPRYAYRELQYNKFLPDGSDPDFSVSGESLLAILGKVMDAEDVDVQEP
jgi:hypothetical protein